MNPEFSRNVWLELSPSRAVIMGGVLSVILGLAWVVGADDASAWAGEKAVAVTAATLFFLVAGLWGSIKAGRAVADEIRDRTWDFQRMSGLSPAAMTIGKLFGATAYVWVGGLFCLGVLAIMAMRLEGLGPALVEVARLGLCALFAHATALAVSLAGARRNRMVNRLSNGLFILAGLVAYAAADALSRDVAGLAALRESWRAPPEGPVVLDWWGWRWDGRGFALGSLAGFAAMAGLTAWRLMRIELQARPNPLWFGGAALALAAWIAGFGDPPMGPIVTLAVALSAIAWVMMWAEPKDVVRWRALAQAMAQREGEAGALWPAALTALALALAASLGVLIVGVQSGATLSEEGAGVIAPLAVWAFVARDMGVTAFFHLGENQRRGDFAVIVALGLSYFVGPILFSAVGFDRGVTVFVPFEEVGPWWLGAISCASGLAQASVWIALAGMRWKARGARLAAGPAPLTAPG